MKRTLLSLLACLVMAIQLSAQKIDFAVKGGLNVNFVKVKSNSRTYSGAGPGLHAGILTNLELAPNIKLQPGANLTYKHFKSSDLNGMKVNHLSLDIPVVALYEKNNFFGGLGPSFNFGLLGNYRYDEDKYKLYDKKNEGRFSIKRVEVALNIMAGYKWKNDIFFCLSFAPGISNLFNHSAYVGSDTKVKTSVLSLSAGYPLNSLIKKK